MQTLKLDNLKLAHVYLDKYRSKHKGKVGHIFFFFNKKKYFVCCGGTKLAKSFGKYFDFNFNLFEENEFGSNIHKIFENWYKSTWKNKGDIK